MVTIVRKTVTETVGISESQSEPAGVGGRCEYGMLKITSELRAEPFTVYFVFPRLAGREKRAEVSADGIPPLTDAI